VSANDDLFQCQKLGKFRTQMKIALICPINFNFLILGYADTTRMSAIDCRVLGVLARCQYRKGMVHFDQCYLNTDL
jgi:hypothetical protein